MIEKDIEKYLVKKVKKLGGLCYKFISPGNAGVPDRIVILNGRLTFIELKRPGGKTRPIQDLQIQKLLNQGQRVEVLDSLDGIDGYLEEMVNGV